MSYQVGRPLGFAISRDTGGIGNTINLGGLNALGDLQWVDTKAPIIIDRTDIEDPNSTTEVSWRMNGIFRDWGMVPPQMQTSAVIDTNGGYADRGWKLPRKATDKRVTEGMLAAWRDVDFDSQHRGGSVDPEMEQIDQRLRWAIEVLRKYPNLQVENEDVLFDYIHQQFNRVFGRCVRRESPGISNCVRDRMPLELKRNHEFVMGMTWRQMGIMSLRDKRDFYEEALNHMDVAEMWAMASGHFNRVAQCLEEEGRFRDAAAFYIESARLIEIAGFRVHKLGERDDGRYGGAGTAAQADRLIKGYLHAYDLSKDELNDYGEALRLAILNVRTFTETGWDPEIFERNLRSDVKFGMQDGLLLLQRTIDPYVTLEAFLTDAIEDFMKNHIDPENMDTGGTALVGEAKRLLKRLKRTIVKGKPR